MFRKPYVIPTAILAALLCGCVSQEQYRRALADSDNLRTQRDELQDYLAQLERDNADLRARNQELEGTVGDAEWVRRKRAEIEKLLNGAELPPSVIIERTSEGVVFNIAGEVLFAPGQAELTTEGQGTLRQLAPTLTAQDRPLRVEGHTDSDKIQHSSWGTNLRLSVERGLAVVEFLKSAGVPEERLSVAGYGEFSPKASNDTPEGKRLNRRVAIQVRGEG